MSSVSLPVFFPTASRTRLILLATPILVACADFLLFGYRPGINLAIMTSLIALSAAALATRPWTRLSFVLASFVLIAIALLVENVSLPATALGLAALALFCIERFAGPPASWTLWGAALGHFHLSVIWRPLRDLIRLMNRPGKIPGRSALFSKLVTWIVPLVLGVVFLELFRLANPLIDKTISGINLDTAFAFFTPSRIIFWLIALALIWSYLRPRLKQIKEAKAKVPAKDAPQSALFGADATARALVVFNLMFAIQTALDLTYLWGGVSLPDGMTYAQYAHRGAYPLVATALLAALFVLHAMRENGPGRTNQSIRLLIYFWIAQNLLLCLSAILRLELYVEVYSLTQFRLAAGAWMVLVAIGLGLIIARIIFNKSGAWLISSNLVSLSLVLVFLSVVDTAALVANYNVDHSAEMGGNGPPLDIYYLTTMGPSVLPALDRFYARAPESGQDDVPSAKIQPPLNNYYVLLRSDAQNVQRNWRSWSFRNHRLDAYLRHKGE